MSRPVADWANLKRLAYFAAVVECGSFTSAAERLGITKAVVSQQVARLEAEFRTALLFRTTRTTRPTEAGLVFYRRCAAILRDAEHAFGELSETAGEPSGELRLTAPLDYGIGVVVPTIASFMQRYPQCKVHAMLSDQTLDMMARNIELAIRVGWITDTQLQVRRIGTFQQWLVAAPQWQAEADLLGEPSDMVRLPFVANTILREPLRWRFSRGESEIRDVELRAAVSLDGTLPVHQAVLLGVGLSVLPDYAIASDVAAGRLIRVLPAWGLLSGGIHVVFPTARFRPPKVRAFVDLLAERAERPLTDIALHRSGSTLDTVP